MIRLFLLFAIIGNHCANAQKYSAVESLVTFYSDAPLEEIRAENKSSRAIVDLSTSEMAFMVPIGGFKFKKKLMQEHFNEKYMETEKYPNATFQGTIVGFNPDNEGEQKVTAKGQLNIHGKTQEVEVPGNLTINKGNLKIATSFIVKVEDYDITIPQLLWQNIAEEVEVSLEFELKE